MRAERKSASGGQDAVLHLPRAEPLEPGRGVTPLHPH